VEDPEKAGLADTTAAIWCRRVAVRRNTSPKHGPEGRQRVPGRATAGMPSDHVVPHGRTLVRRSVEHPASVRHVMACVQFDKAAGHDGVRGEVGADEAHALRWAW
jgi:hypothetical protein